MNGRGSLYRRFSAGLMWSFLASGAVLLVLCGALLGFMANRPHPRFIALRLEETTFHAGEDIKTQRKTEVPPDCIPKMARWIHFYGDPAHDIEPFDHILTDAPGPADGSLGVATSARMPTGLGAYTEKMSAQGCGWLSGVFPPLGDTAKAVPVTVLPAIPIK